MRPIQFIPGAISFLRILIGLAFPWLPGEWRLPAVVLGGLTDLLDGQVSRLLKAQSLWGRLLDPIADKIFFFAVVGTLLADGSLAWWEALLVGTRDLAVLIGAGIMLLKKGWALSARMYPRLLGKLTTGLQILYVVALLWDPQTLAGVLLVPTAVASCLAAVDYYFAMRADAVGPK